MRYYSTVEAVQTVVDKSTLSKLRKKTGFPLLNCKKALEKFDNDIKQVIHAPYLYPSLVLVQPRKTRPYTTERLLMGRKESNQTKQNAPRH